MQPKLRFANVHPHDRNFFLVMTLFIWAAILSGFGYEIVLFSKQDRLHFPLITHVHALLFVCWLLLFTIQIFLIRKQNFLLHKKLGLVSFGLIPLMVIAGFAVAVLSEQRKFGTPYSDPAFISIMFSDMFVFGGIAAAGIYLRKRPAAHKRLLLFATISLTDAGFGRWFSMNLTQWLFNIIPTSATPFSKGFLPFFIIQSLCPLMLLLAMGFYDFLTRKRLHPVYPWALAWWFLFNLLENWLYFYPPWLELTKRMIGH
jgi:hypothetical protein